MKLGFHSHVPAIIRGGQIYTPGSQGVFLDSLAPYCGKLICFLHSPNNSEQGQCDYLIQSDNIGFINIGEHTSIPNRMVHTRTYSRPVYLRKSDLDALLIRGPSPLLPAIAACIPLTPKILLLVASYKAGMDSLVQPFWRKTLIQIWIKWYEAQQSRIARNSLVFVNSHVLYNEFKPIVRDLVEIRTSTIKSSDFYFRGDTCQQTPYRILFVGRITPAKGLKDIITAVAISCHQEIDCLLDIIGAPEDTQYIDDLLRYSHTLGIDGRIKYHGYKSIGVELNYYYRSADVFIVASQSYEGFPRTIWEAFSQSTPVIATKVGSIPFFLQHEHDVLLASPNNPEELAACLKRIFFEPELRQRLIRNGIIQAQNNTLDFRAREMIHQIESWLNQQNKE